MDYKKTIEIAYDNFANKYDAQCALIMISFTTKLLNGLQFSKNPTVLDVGCGTGIATFELMKKTQGKGKFYGIDLSQRMIDEAKRKALDFNYANVEFCRGDAEKLDFPESSFDLVISNQVFHWIKNKEAFLRELFRVIKPTGKAALVFQGGKSFEELFKAYDKIQKSHPEYELSERPKSLTIKKTRELFKSVGFKEIEIYEIQKNTRIHPSLFSSNEDLYTCPWKIGISLSNLTEAQKKIKNELQLMKKDWEKTRIVNIFGIGTKTS